MAQYSKTFYSCPKCGGKLFFRQVGHEVNDYYCGMCEKSYYKEDMERTVTIKCDKCYSNFSQNTCKKGCPICGHNLEC